MQATVIPSFMFDHLYLQIRTTMDIKVKFKFIKRIVLWTQRGAKVPTPMRTQTIQCATVGANLLTHGLGSAGQPSQNSEAWILQHTLGQAEKRIGAEKTDCGAE